MNTEQNVLAELAHAKRMAVDSQVFTYGFRVFVPNYAKHSPQNFPWPGNTPGTARLRFRVDEDAHFRIDQVTVSAYGPVLWTANVKEADQAGLRAPGGATLYPLPGWQELMGKAVFTATFDNTTDEATVSAGGGTRRVGQPVMFVPDAGAVMPDGVLANTVYYILGANPIADVFQFSTTPGGGNVDFTTNGSGTIRARLLDDIDTVNLGTDEITVNGSHGVGAYDYIRDGQPVAFEPRYSTGAIAPDSNLPAPLVRGTEYYARRVSADVITVHPTPLDALLNTNIIDLTAYAPVAGVTVYVLFKDAVAERGVMCQVTDLSKVERKLTNDFAPIETLWQPAYGSYVPGVGKDVQSFLSGYILPKQHELLLEFRNRDQAGLLPVSSLESDPQLDFYHVLHFAFTGVQFYD